MAAERSGSSSIRSGTLAAASRVCRPKRCATALLFFIAREAADLKRAASVSKSLDCSPPFPVVSKKPLSSPLDIVDSSFGPLFMLQLSTLSAVAPTVVFSTRCAALTLIFLAIFVLPVHSAVIAALKSQELLAQQT